MTVLALCCTGGAVKLLDDLLDGPDDLAAGLGAWTHRLGPAAAAYALALLALGAALAPGPALTAFFAAYALGMCGDLWSVLPSRLPAWLEGLLALMVGALSWGPVTMLGALLAVLGAQCLDDWIDWQREGFRGHGWWPRGLGRVELLGVAILAALGAAWVRPWLLVGVAVATVIWGNLAKKLPVALHAGAEGGGA